MRARLSPLPVLLFAACLAAAQNPANANPAPQNPPTNRATQNTSPSSAASGAASGAAQNSQQTPDGYSIAGVIVNSTTGQPVADAVLTVAAAAARRSTHSVYTEADGRFRFSGLARGKYALTAAALGATEQAFEQHGNYSTAVAVGPDIDSEHIVFRLVPDAFVEGKVTDENSDPVRDASVSVFRKSTEDGRSRTTLVQQANTDDEGEYFAAHLSPGQYYIAVSARPWYAQSFGWRQRGQKDPSGQEGLLAKQEAELDVTFPMTFYPDATDWTAASPIPLHPGERLTADINMHSVPAAHLLIRTGDSRGPQAGQIFIPPSIMQRIFEGYLSQDTNAQPNFLPSMVEIEGLAPGDYVVQMPGRAATKDAPAKPGWTREIQLSGDTEITAGETSSLASVAGTVSSDGGVRGRVFVALADREGGQDFGAQVSPDGEFKTTEDVRPGLYDVELRGDQNMAITRLSATGAKVIGRQIQVDGGTVRLAITASRALGTIDGVAMHDGKPLSGAMIVLVPQDPVHDNVLFRRDQSDSDGTFTLPQIVPGRYSIIAITNRWDAEWADPTVLAPYLKSAQAVQVAPNAHLQIQVQAQ